MTTYRIALANVRIPSSPEDSVRLAERAIADAGAARADIVCFPECFVPGYRWPGRNIPRVEAAFLEKAWSTAAAAAAAANVAVILGTERIAGDELRMSAIVINRDGSIAGYQDKVQLDPSEENPFSPGTGRRLFSAGALKFGVTICHEAFRYPETVRWAVREGAHIVFQPFYDEAVAASHRPTTFADPANSFHEKAALCRAAENACYFAMVNCASDAVPMTSALIGPDGTVLAYQPYGVEGLLIADIDIALATGLYARRLRPTAAEESHQGATT
jgi:predicted amidohydrolase